MIPLSLMKIRPSDKYHFTPELKYAGESWNFFYLEWFVGEVGESGYILLPPAASMIRLAKLSKKADRRNLAIRISTNTLQFKLIFGFRVIINNHIIMHHFEGLICQCSRKSY